MLPGKLMLVLYKETGDERYATVAKAIHKRLDTYPRTEDGALWHATSRQHQLWLDGTYMALPFLVRFGETFDDKTYAYNEATKNLLCGRCDLLSEPATLRRRSAWAWRLHPDEYADAQDALR